MSETHEVPTRVPPCTLRVGLVDTLGPCANRSALHLNLGGPRTSPIEIYHARSCCNKKRLTLFSIGSPGDARAFVQLGHVVNERVTTLQVLGQNLHQGNTGIVLPRIHVIVDIS